MSDATRFILVVDDEPAILSALRRELRLWASEREWGVEGFGSAAAALEFISADPAAVALVISDSRMPGMGGGEFLLEARRRWPGLPTILLSGYADAEELAKSVRAGISGYVLKPWEPERLIAEMEKAIAAREHRELHERRERTMDEELRLAGELQRAMLRPETLEPPGLEARFTWEPVPGLYCGGDYYDLFPLGDGSTLLFLCDVAGHGLRAALVTFMLKTMIFPEYVRARRGGAVSPADFLGWLNGRLARDLSKGPGMLVTAFAARLDPGRGRLVHASAGHVPPYLLRRGGVLALESSSPPFGFLDEHSYQESELPLERGDLLFAYTDGLVEIGARCGSDPLPALREVLAAGWPHDELHRRAIEACRAAACGGEFEDDLSIVSLKVR